MMTTDPWQAMIDAVAGSVAVIPSVAVKCCQCCRGVTTTNKVNKGTMTVTAADYSQQWQQSIVALS